MKETKGAEEGEERGGGGGGGGGGMQWNIIIRNEMCLCRTKVPENWLGKSYFT